MTRQDWERDDQFLDQLSQGIVPDGDDKDLAALLVSLRDEINTDIPDAPVLDDTLVDSDASGDSHSSSALAPVASLAGLRRRRGQDRGGQARGQDRGSQSRGRRRAVQSRPQRWKNWTSGLIGAAAASAFIATAGFTVYNAEPGSPLWSTNQVIFGDDSTRVELASTLEQLEDSVKRGDEETTRKSIEEARNLLRKLRGNSAVGDEEKSTRPVASGSAPRTTTKPVRTTITKQAEPPSEPRSEEPTALRAQPDSREVVTETVRVTVTETATVVPPESSAAPTSATSEPSVTETATPTEQNPTRSTTSPAG